MAAKVATPASTKPQQGDDAGVRRLTAKQATNEYHVPTEPWAKVVVAETYLDGETEVSPEFIGFLGDPGLVNGCVPAEGETPPRTRTTTTRTRRTPAKATEAKA